MEERHETPKKAETKAEAAKQKGEHAKEKELEKQFEITKKHLEDLQEQYKQLVAKQDKVLNTAAYYKNQAEETKADFDRFKARNKNIEADAAKRASEQTAKKILPIIDNFDQAMLTISPEVMKGFAMIYSSLCGVLSDLGVSEICPSEGESLDPNRHNCIDTAKTKDKSLDGKVAKVYQKGYMFAETGEVIRAATVSVYKANL